MPAKIKQGKYVDSDGVQQNVVFIGAEKAIFDDDGTRLDNKLADMSKASGLTAEDAEGLLGTPDANVNFQALVDAIANKVMNELVTNSALTAQLANYVTKAMMSNEQVNDNDHVPTSSLVYNMNEDITQLNSELTSGESVSQEDYWDLTNGEIQSFTAKKKGSELELCASIKLSAQISDNAIIGTIKPQFRPIQNYVIISLRNSNNFYLESGTVWLYTDGTIRAYGNISANTIFFVQKNYMLT